MASCPAHLQTKQYASGLEQRVADLEAAVAQLQKS